MAQPRTPRGVPAGGRWVPDPPAESGVRLGPSDGAVPAWPATSVEVRPWTTNPDLHGISGARPNRDDRLLTRIEVEIPAQIADLPLRLDSAAVLACEDAARAIASLESDGQHLAALGELLVRTEAVASSRIEHIYADLDEVARATIGEQAAETAVRTVASMRALGNLTSSCDAGAPLTEQAILDAHRSLLAGDPLEGQFAGRFRTQQNWIGGSDFTPRGAVHVPPPHELVADLMRDLVAFANRNDVLSLGQAAVVHGQFEAIHPFTDGNGRVGRGIISAMLRRRGVTKTVVVPVAAAMLADVDTYFDRLKDYRDGNPDALVTYMAESSISACDAARESATYLATLPDRWRDQVRARRGSAAETLINGLMANSILDIARAEAVTGASRPRTYQAIDRLAGAGVLDEITGGGRNRIWVAHDVLTELRTLEERIGVRSKPSQRWGGRAPS
jgi:Fic family protein